ncbi:rac GTPase-activating protein 1-like [Heptranchias perlo]|uniref:rac GTPase-activating protein 1-like n=1 Tax=Heptranchias perlo TaxID=212740 RepID=UPI00355A7887
MNFENCRKKWNAAEEQLVESKNQLTKVEIERTSFEVRLMHARNQLDIELKRRHKAELACEHLERRLQLVHDMLRNEGPTVGVQNVDRQSLLTALTGRTGQATHPCTRLPVVDETLTSNLSHSGISYDTTSDEPLEANVSAMKQTKRMNRDRRCSTRILVDGPPVTARRSRSLSSGQLLDNVGSTPGSANDTTASNTGEEGRTPVRTPMEVAPRRHSEWNRRLGLLAEKMTVEHGSVENLLTAPAPPPATPTPNTFRTPRNPVLTRPHIFVSKTDTGENSPALQNRGRGIVNIHKRADGASV